MFFICLLFVILCKAKLVNKVGQTVFSGSGTVLFGFWDVNQTSQLYNVPTCCFGISQNLEILVTEWLVEFVMGRMLKI